MTAPVHHASPEVESAFLAAYLSEPAEAFEYASGVDADYFTDPVNSAIWQAATELIEQGMQVNYVLIGDRVATANPALKSVIFGKIAELHVNAQPIQAIPTYREILQRYRTARALVDAGLSAQAIAHDVVAATDPDKVKLALATAQDTIIRVGENAGVQDSLKRIDHTVVAALDALDEQADKPAQIFSTGITDLDRALGGGMHPGEMFVVAARPGVGKSTLGMDILRHNAIREKTACAMFSLEMSQSDCALRVVAAEAKVPLGHLRDGNVPSDSDWDAIGTAVSRISDAPLFIDDTPSVNMAYLNAQVQYLVRRHNIRIVVVDYLQLMSGNTGQDRYQAVSDISRGLKILAKEHDLVVIAIAQLNRGPEQRVDKKPQPSDLRESGQIEQDSDVILLLYREDSFEPDSVRAGEADIIIGKQRNGPRATVTCAFQGEYCRFVDMAPEAPY